MTPRPTGGAHGSRKMPGHPPHKAAIPASMPAGGPATTVAGGAPEHGPRVQRYRAAPVPGELGGAQRMQALRALRPPSLLAASSTGAKRPPTTVLLAPCAPRRLNAIGNNQKAPL